MMPRLLACLIGFLFLIGCESTEDTPSSPPVDHIKYFGFTLVDTYWDDPTDSETKNNYNDEVSDFSNMADILVVNPTDNIVDRMKAMESLQMKSILHLHELFFEIEGTNAPSGTDYRLRTDAQERWDMFLGINSLYVNQDLVQALYVGEEPTWNGISFTELKKVSDYVKLTIPDITVMVVEAYPALNDFQIPTSVDWVGFDHYFIKDPKNDGTFISELNILKSKLSEEQNLILIMDTHYIDFAHGDFGGIALDEMASVAKSYFELAKSEPRTIAIIGYFWPSGFDDVNAIGARHMPTAVREEYSRIGKEITKK
ncbi:hypothetical protein FEE95_14890 [Maribacter algarum]|uniref:Glycoside hydrolase family 5 domain-containing protein n=1 Tax=Maribacter algarum (ex Zhang et al. 2020) TaxID=2578118 RepID=A0A5S3PNJ3_9FLAO|nr:hypothetical protein [Maribacter algarum]TMM55931.1 hypothetical protein FEE95_14890 [Maribacter algarum]